MSQLTTTSSQSSFFRGLARLFDFGGVFSRTAPLKVSDQEALREDWRAVGRDLQIAIKAYDAYRKKSGKRSSAAGKTTK